MARHWRIECDPSFYQQRQVLKGQDISKVLDETAVILEYDNNNAFFKSRTLIGSAKDNRDLMTYFLRESDPYRGKEIGDPFEIKGTSIG